MIKFFKPEDFGGDFITDACRENIARIANAKLESETVYVYANYSSFQGKYNMHCQPGDTVKIRQFKSSEPIKTCTHPVEKIRISFQRNITDEFSLNPSSYQCECGARVKPSGFVEEA